MLALSFALPSLPGWRDSLSVPQTDTIAGAVASDQGVVKGLLPFNLTAQLPGVTRPIEAAGFSVTGGEFEN